MADIPAYRKVYISLKENIKLGKYKPGMLLPTEPELETIYSVSRTTIRKAVSLLVSDGYLKVRQGHGTEVMDISTTQRLNKITSITETLTQKGYKVTTQGMCIDQVPADEETAQALELSNGDIVFRLQRVQCTDGNPIAIMTNYIKPNIAPDLDQHVNQFTSLYSFLEKQYNIVISDAMERLSAIAADFSDSQILQIPFASPLILSKRITRNEQGPFEYAIIKLLADKYEFSVYLHGRK